MDDKNEIIFIFVEMIWSTIKIILCHILGAELFLIVLKDVCRSVCHLHKKINIFGLKLIELVMMLCQSSGKSEQDRVISAIVDGK